jgi:hypothetical protein
MSTTWFIWDITSIIFYAFAGLMGYIMSSKAKQEYPESRILHPYLVGLAISLVGWFSTGLFVFISAVLYMSFVQIIDSIGNYLKKRSRQ